MVSGGVVRTRSLAVLGVGILNSHPYLAPTPTRLQVRALLTRTSDLTLNFLMIGLNFVSKSELFLTFILYQPTYQIKLSLSIHYCALTHS